MATGEKTSRDLDEVLFRERRSHTSRDVAGLAGVPVYRARRFWRALGLPNVGEGEAEFTNADVEALRILVRIVEGGVVNEATALQLTRSLGQAAARLADSQAELAVRGVDDAGLAGNERLRAGYHLGRRLLPDLEQLLVYAWRRHLAAAANRLDQMDQATGATSLTVGFADLVAFTRLARQLELAELAGLVERFESRSADMIAHSGGRVVKTLGDSVLFVAGTPALAAETALCLVGAHASDPVLPPLRVGVAFGPVVSRMGDVFGNTVNLASRLTALADPDNVVIDVSMAEALSIDEKYDLWPISRRIVRGFGSIEPFTLTRRPVPSVATLPPPRVNRLAARCAMSAQPVPGHRVKALLSHPQLPLPNVNLAANVRCLLERRTRRVEHAPQGDGAGRGLDRRLRGGRRATMWQAEHITRTPTRSSRLAST